MYDDDANILAALQAGAHGYLVKGAGPEEVLSAVRAVARGNAVFGASLAARMLEVFGNRPAAPVAERFPELSRREREVLEHLAEGRTNQQIGELLFISPITVRNHVSNILAKLPSDRPPTGHAPGPGRRPRAGVTPCLHSPGASAKHDAGTLIMRVTTPDR